MKYLLWICADEPMPTTLVTIEADTIEQARQIAKDAIETWDRVQKDVFGVIYKPAKPSYLVPDVGEWI